MTEEMWLRWAKDTHQAAWVLTVELLKHPHALPLPCGTMQLSVHMMTKCMVEKWETERNGSRAVGGGRTEDRRARRSGLMLVAWLAHKTRVTSRPGLLLTTISGSAIVEVCVSVHGSRCCQGHGDAWGVGHHLWPLWCPWVMPPPGPC